MTLIDCDSTGVALASAMDNEPWQKRAKMAGLSQKTLAKLLGVAENTMSMQLRGKWATGTPRYVMFAILAWERLPQSAKEELIHWSEEDRG